MKAFVLALLFLALPITAFGAPYTGIQMTTNPQSPRPGERVTVKATLISANPKEYDFRWSVGGGVVAEGLGYDSITVDAPQLGQTKTVVLTVSGESSTASETVIIRPAEVSIVWEGRSSTPPLYTGRPLVPAQGGGVALAVAELVRASGVRVPNSEIRYTWSLNGKQQSAGSGYGLNTFSFQPPFFNSAFTLSVVAETRDGLRAERSAVVGPQTPEVVVYQVSPLRGIEMERAVVNSFQFIDEEVSFKAYPLYVTNPNDLSVQWTLDNTPVVIETGDPYLAVFRKTGAGSGSYSVGVALSHATKFLERGAFSFLLTF